MEAEMQDSQTEPWSERLFDYALSVFGMIILLSPLALWMSWSQTIFYIILGTGLGAMAAVAVMVTLFPEKRRRWLPSAPAPEPRLPQVPKPLTPGDEFRQLALVIALLLAAGIGLFVLLWAVL